MSNWDACPICQIKMSRDALPQHIESCLSRSNSRPPVQNKPVQHVMNPNGTKTRPHSWTHSRVPSRPRRSSSAKFPSALPLGARQQKRTNTVFVNRNEYLEGRDVSAGGYHTFRHATSTTPPYGNRPASHTQSIPMDGTSAALPTNSILFSSMKKRSLERGVSTYRSAALEKYKHLQNLQSNMTPDPPAQNPALLRNSSVPNFRSSSGETSSSLLIESNKPDTDDLYVPYNFREISIKQSDQQSSKVYKEGWLYISKNRYNGYERKYAVLKDQTIWCHDVKLSQSASISWAPGLCQLAISLKQSNALKSNVYEQTKMKHSFMIENQDGSGWYFAAENDADRKGWVEALQAEAAFLLTSLSPAEVQRACSTEQLRKQIVRTTGGSLLGDSDVEDEEESEEEDSPVEGDGSEALDFFKSIEDKLDGIEAVRKERRVRERQKTSRKKNLFGIKLGSSEAKAFAEADTAWMKQVLQHPNDSAIILNHLEKIFRTKEHRLGRFTVNYVNRGVKEALKAEKIADAIRAICSFIDRVVATSVSIFSVLANEFGTNCIYLAAENCIFGSAYPEIMRRYNEVYQADDTKRQQKFTELAHITPMHIIDDPNLWLFDPASGIREEDTQSLLRQTPPYFDAIKILKEINNENTPGGKLNILHLTEQEIYKSIKKYVYLQRKKKKDEGLRKVESIGADELVPIFFFVLVKAKVDTCFSECQFMQDFLDCSKRTNLGKARYLLTTYYCILEALMIQQKEDMEVHALEHYEKLMKDKIK